jgi:tripartite-type tricarboxylate transporter receptor subunit TctC
MVPIRILVNCASSFDEQGTHTVMKKAALIAILLPFCSWAASAVCTAQEWSPSQPVRLIVPFQAGGPMDTVARTIAQQLGEKWNQNFVVENRTGGSGNIGSNVVAKASPDGYTIGMASGGTHGANVTLFGPKMPYDPIRDFTAVTLLVHMKNVLVVHPSLPIRSLPELIAYAKNNPRQLSFGSSGTGSVQHLTGEMFKTATGIDIVHVAYRGQAQALPDLVSGRVSMMFLGAGDAAQHISAGALVPIGLSSRERTPLLPNVAPLAEQGLSGFDAVTWFGLVAPAGTADEIVQAYHKQISLSFAQPDTRSRLQEMGLDVVMMPPKEFAKFIANEVVKWGAVVNAVGARLE